MTLPASGPISMSQVAVELGLSPTAQISLNDPAIRALFSKPTGPISLSDGYGKSAKTYRHPISNWVPFGGYGFINPHLAYDGPINDSGTFAEASWLDHRRHVWVFWDEYSKGTLVPVYMRGSISTQTDSFSYAGQTAEIGSMVAVYYSIDSGATWHLLKMWSGGEYIDSSSVLHLGDIAKGLDDVIYLRIDARGFTQSGSIQDAEGYRENYYLEAPVVCSVFDLNAYF